MTAAIVDDLVRHKWYANGAYVSAVYRHETARHDEELRKLFLHILVANRFWLFLTLGKEFDQGRESRFPGALEPLIESYKETAAMELEWLSRCDDAELRRQLITPRLPGESFTVSEAVTQICLHSYGHRSQSAMRLRSLGGTPPPTDFILWVTERPGPEWPATSQLSGQE